MPCGFADEVEDLRQVDDDEPVAGREDVVRREVAVHDAVLGHQGQRLAQLVEVRRQQRRLRPGLGEPRGASRRRTRTHSIRISVPSICTG